MVWAGFCQDKRFLIEWVERQPDGRQVSVRAVRTGEGEYRILYMTPDGWAQWSSKSGVVIGPVPELEGGA